MIAETYQRLIETQEQLINAQKQQIQNLLEQVRNYKAIEESLQKQVDILTKALESLAK